LIPAFIDAGLRGLVWIGVDDLDRELGPRSKSAVEDRQA
jgi:hypothetical protein